MKMMSKVLVLALSVALCGCQSFASFDVPGDTVEARIVDTRTAYVEWRVVHPDDYGFICGNVSSAGCAIVDYDAKTCVIYTLNPLVATSREHQEYLLAVLGHEFMHCVLTNLHQQLEDALS